MSSSWCQNWSFKYIQHIIQGCIQNLFKHLRWSFYRINGWNLWTTFTKISILHGRLGSEYVSVIYCFFQTTEFFNIFSNSNGFVTKNKVLSSQIYPKSYEMFQWKPKCIFFNPVICSRNTKRKIKWKLKFYNIATENKTRAKTKFHLRKLLKPNHLKQIADRKFLAITSFIFCVEKSK